MRKDHDHSGTFLVRGGWHPSASTADTSQSKHPRCRNDRGYFRRARKTFQKTKTPGAPAGCGRSAFSFGASVEEHLPEQCEPMLRDFHQLLLKMLGLPYPVLVVIRGQCLGGGLELACTGALLFAGPDAKMGQPEIMLGVIAPAASCLLPSRIGQSIAEDLLISGRSIGAEEAFQIGLVNCVDEDPEKKARAYFKQHLASKSASSLRLAVQAVRKGVIGDFKRKLSAVEELYLEQLMKTGDAEEGLKAFLEKRPPKWEDC